MAYDAPSPLTKVPIKPRHTLYSTSKSRCMIQRKRDEEIILEQSSQDKFGTIDELNEKIDKAKLPQDVVIIKSKEHIVFFEVSLSEKPFIPYSLKIKASLEFQVWNNNSELTLNAVKDVLSTNMCTCSAGYEILNFLQDKSQGEITDKEILESVIKTLQDRWLYSKMSE